MIKLLIGSNNKHKLHEINAIFNVMLPKRFELIAPESVLNEKFDVLENGATIEENASLKSNAFFTKTGINCFADDTGLFIDELNGLPGKDAARFADDHGNDAANRKKVLDLLDGVTDEKRTARFRTAICFSCEKGDFYAHGICEGKILNHEQGAGGFGYDAIFVPDGFNLTFAEMNDVMKNQISHRADAILNFIEFLKNFYNIK